METFFEHYAMLQRKEKNKFRKRIVEVCSIEPPTWYSWQRRKIIPKQSQKLIAMEMNQPVEQLFPD